ncbi:hypothetical protein E2C01_019123 [Portunus trituberculatus]|uniref:Uncharacterized protein n=1 Tax=Portunus trituberculatus TaxID=210409 RepID=A0A5B7DYB7_PORTR|nr:hypothetical protein [Portunus trituberculatus]
MKGRQLRECSAVRAPPVGHLYGVTAGNPATRRLNHRCSVCLFLTLQPRTVQVMPTSQAAAGTLTDTRAAPMHTAFLTALNVNELRLRTCSCVGGSIGGRGEGERQRR